MYAMWTFIWLAALTLIAVGAYLYEIRDRHKNYYHRRGPGPFWTGAVIAIVSLVLSFFGTAEVVTDAVEARSDIALVEERTRIRDELAEVVRDELSAEQYRELMAALPDAELLWLSTAGTSDVLRDRAGRIIALNEQIYELEMGIVTKRKAVCDYIDNPFYPHFPFGLGLPDCELEIER